MAFWRHLYTVSRCECWSAAPIFCFRTVHCITYQYLLVRTYMYVPYTQRKSSWPAPSRLEVVHTPPGASSLHKDTRTRTSFSSLITLAVVGTWFAFNSLLPAFATISLCPSDSGLLLHQDIHDALRKGINPQLAIPCYWYHYLFVF